MRPPLHPDACKFTEEHSENSLILGNKSTLSGFLKMRDLNRASPLALSVLQSVREGTLCGRSLSVQGKTKVGKDASNFVHVEI